MTLRVRAILVFSALAGVVFGLSGVARAADITSVGVENSSTTQTGAVVINGTVQNTNLANTNSQITISQDQNLALSGGVVLIQPDTNKPTEPTPSDKTKDGRSATGTNINKEDKSAPKVIAGSDTTAIVPIAINSGGGQLSQSALIKITLSNPTGSDTSLTPAAGSPVQANPSKPQSPQPPISDNGWQQLSSLLGQTILPLLTSVSSSDRVVHGPRFTTSHSSAPVKVLILIFGLSLFVAWLHRGGFQYAARSDVSVASILSFVTLKSVSSTIEAVWSNSLFSGESYQLKLVT